MSKSQRNAFIVIAAIGITVFLAVKFTTGSGKHSHGLVKVDASGNAKVLGIKTANPVLRHVVFEAIGKSGYTGGVLIVASPTNLAQESNLIQTLNAASRAGIIRTAPSNRTNEYE